MVAVRDFKKFVLQRDGTFVDKPHKERKSFQRNKDDKNGKCEKNGLSVEIQIISSENVRNYQKSQNQKALFGRYWSESDEDEERRRQRTKSVIWLKLPDEVNFRNLKT
ncbi:hypothetical protein Tco_0803017 [Tanacetum coccineum]|uniref:Uncharacterized protein n=1 Tax=Tanacetum coccineum TaxID=301880 RepID=A0ABQ5A0E2_9ASTR